MPFRLCKLQGNMSMIALMETLKMNNRARRLFFVLIMALPVLSGIPANAQKMTMQEVIDVAKTQSVIALEAKAEFVSDWWAWRSYMASRLPTLSLYGEAGNYSRYLNLLQKPETGEMVYTTTNNLKNSLGLRASQNIIATGGTLSLYSELTRIDQFGQNAGKTWYAEPLTLSYRQPLFAYNQFKWNKLISPKEYERARRSYLESMENLTMLAAKYFYSLMLAGKVYETSGVNYANTSRMLGIARERLGLGTVTRDELLQLELRQLKDSIAINENLVSLKQARMQLNSLLGYDESHELEPVLEEVLPDIMMDFDLVYRKCTENSSFNLQNQINVLNAESAVAKAKADRGITMTLSANFGLTNTGPQLSSAYQNLLDQEVIGLSFSIPIFDWGLGKGKVKKAEAAAEVVRAQVEQAENDKRISLFTAVGQFNNQRNQCYVSGRASTIAQERYSLVMDKFRSGKATVTDLNTARSESDDAMRQYINDIASYWNYYYTLRSLTLYDFIAGEDITVSYDEMVE